jgi:hypothetical protein
VAPMMMSITAVATITSIRLNPFSRCMLGSLAPAQ